MTQTKRCTSRLLLVGQKGLLSRKTKDNKVTCRTNLAVMYTVANKYA